MHKCGIIIFTPYLYVKGYRPHLTTLMETVASPLWSRDDLTPAMFAEYVSLSQFTLSRKGALAILVNQ